MGSVGWSWLCPSAVRDRPCSFPCEANTANSCKRIREAKPVLVAAFSLQHHEPRRGTSCHPPTLWEVQPRHRSLPCAPGEQRRRAELRVSTLTPFLPLDGSWREDEQQNIHWRETSPSDPPVRPVAQAGEKGQPRESSAGALEQLAATECVCSDENNFPLLVLLTNPTWRPPSPPANNNTRAGWDRIYFQQSCQLHWGLWGSLGSSLLQASKGKCEITHPPEHCQTPPSFLPHHPPWRAPTHPQGHGDGQQGLGQGQGLPWGERCQDHTHKYTQAGVTCTDRVCSSHEKVSLELPVRAADTEIPPYPSPSPLERARAPPDPGIPWVPG